MLLKNRTCWELVINRFQVQCTWKKADIHNICSANGTNGKKIWSGFVLDSFTTQKSMVTPCVFFKSENGLKYLLSGLKAVDLWMQMNLSLPVRHLGHQSIWQPEDITTLTWVVAAIVWDLCHHQALTNGCVPNVVHVNMFPWQWSLQSWERMACNVLRTTFLWKFSLGSKVVRIFCWQTETPTLAINTWSEFMN